ncbi:hypothetical protein [Streptomyces mirabilis]|uniref:hypothetical protein n=1 Tax=Streptomyces mirabilis TaxID=68239 RepID=UPI0036485951
MRPADVETVAKDAPDAVITCTGGNPRITHELLTGIQPRDLLLRATGTLLQPPAPGENARLTLDALEVRSCGTWCSTGTATTASSSTL